MKRAFVVLCVSLGLLSGGAVLQAHPADASQPATRASIHQIGKAHTYQVALQGYGRAPAAHTDQSSPNGNG
ncbi:MAG: hypothetical protein LGL72_16660 [Acidibrevibacterium sp.]|jgi:hypothetical protein|uniref:hypothetical protein n=1 Tax=Acidibrevibacterium fodinaquatile TaxID=1969806 RepID=UPI000E0E024E|nr:hypothetical protein [Acidibrevibacterium fodinaquatile]MCA7120980.1 hypothetical protein [Acidibrevibacterium fodinaquatile]